MDEVAEVREEKNQFLDPSDFASVRLAGERARVRKILVLTVAYVF